MAIVVFALAIVIVPQLPNGWFLRSDPYSQGPFLFLRSHTHAATFNTLWAAMGLRHVPLAVRVALMALALATACTPRRMLARLRLRARRLPHDARLLPRLAPLLVLPVLPLLFFMFQAREKRNDLFGDGPKLGAQVEQGKLFVAELLTCHVFQWVHHVLAWCGFPGGRLAVVVTSCLSGGLFVAGVVAFARIVGRDRRERLLLCAGPTLTGSLTMFFGYVETTQVELAVMPWLFAGIAGMELGALRLRGWWVLVTLASLSVACLAHGAGILLVPAAAIAFWDRARAEKVVGPAGFADRWWQVAALLVVAVPYALVLVWPRYMKHQFGNLLGGGDGIMFVPFEFDEALRFNPYVSYAMFSRWHAMDIVSSLLIASPFLLGLGAVVFAFVAKYWNAIDLPNQRLLLIFAMAAGACSAVPLIWNHDFGMWGDWNLAACYWFPSNLLFWTAVVIVHRRLGASWQRFVRVGVPAVIVQAVLGLGILLQFR